MPAPFPGPPQHFPPQPPQASFPPMPLHPGAHLMASMYQGSVQPNMPPPPASAMPGSGREPPRARPEEASGVGRATADRGRRSEDDIPEGNIVCDGGRFVSAAPAADDDIPDTIICDGGNIICDGGRFVSAAPAPGDDIPDSIICDGGNIVCDGGRFVS